MTAWAQRWLRLRPRLAAVAVGRSGYLPLLEVEAFCARYAAHIDKRRAACFLAQEALDEATLAEIGEEMAARRNL
jgi:hypothetical protein